MKYMLLYSIFDKNKEGVRSVLGEGEGEREKGTYFRVVGT